MKLPAKIIITVGIALGLLIPQAAYAEVKVDISGNEGSSRVNVNSQSTGTSTICQNGKCTTTEGESSSTVCINGKCSTSNGDVNYESNDGTTRVQINSNTGNNSIIVGTPTSGPTKTPTPTKPEPTMDPDIQAEIEQAQKEAAEAEVRIKARMKEQESALEAFIKAELENLQKFLDGLFK